MGDSREIITLQFGPTANSIGAHFFNIQSAGFSFNENFITEVNHALLFNEGRSSSGEFTFTPRLISVDYEDEFKGIFSNFKEPPRKSEVENQLGTPVELIRKSSLSAGVSKNEYFEDVKRQEERKNKMVVDVLKSKYDLEQSIRSWPDYLTVPYSEKSVLPVPNYLTPPDTANTTFQSGRGVWKGISDEFEDRLRFQLEAADCIQGVHVLVDSDGHFSGLAKEAIELVKEECGKRTLLGWSCLRPRHCNVENSSEAAKEMLLRHLNLGYSFSWGTELMDMICPFSTEESICSLEPSFRKTWPIDNSYRSSAVLAVALELLTLSYRSRSSSSLMKDIPALLYLPGRKLLAAGLTWPYPTDKLQADFVGLLRTYRPTSLTPNLMLSRDPDILNLAFKGFTDPSPSVSPYVHVARENIRLPRTFPDLLPSESDLASSSHYVGRLRECSGMAGYFNTSEMKVLIDQLLEQTSEAQFKKLPQFTTVDLEPSEMDEMLESVKNLGVDYGTSGFL